MTRSGSDDIERRLFFTTGEDLYFLSYNVLLLLHGVNATPEKPLRDASALPLLITFISDSKLVDLLDRWPGAIPRTSRDYQVLLAAEAGARRKRPFVTRLLNALERRDLVAVDARGKAHSVGIRASARLERFTTAEIFGQERSNVARLRRALPQLKRMSLSTIQERLLTNRGVHAWPA